MATEDNGNIGLLKPMSSSNEDLSEYTDADESISAPTEFLAEFLSAVMLKDYETALKYCKLILQYEPNNMTAKEFYPLILEKLHQQNMLTNEDDDDEEENEDSSSSSSSSSDSESSSSDDSSDQEEDEDDEEGQDGQEQGADKRSKSSSDGGDATTGSYSSLEDDEPEVDQLAALAAKFQIDNVNIGNGNKIYSTDFKSNISSANKIYTNLAATANKTFANETSLPFGSSDSESPTEPVSQQTIAMLRAKVVPNKN
ncbi:uncharacterized protein [Atheta coriaria]|uniref:uncharacterized protein n=1 Tax=Dalotia coriaria TaxID=877792 RepID=UPI0031F47036